MTEDQNKKELTLTKLKHLSDFLICLYAKFLLSSYKLTQKYFMKYIFILARNVALEQIFDCGKCDFAQ